MISYFSVAALALAAAASASYVPYFSPYDAPAHPATYAVAPGYGETADLAEDGAMPIAAAAPASFFAPPASAAVPPFAPPSTARDAVGFVRQTPVPYRRAVQRFYLPNMDESKQAVLQRGDLPVRTLGPFGGKKFSGWSGWLTGFAIGMPCMDAGCTSRTLHYVVQPESVGPQPFGGWQGKSTPWTTGDGSTVECQEDWYVSGVECSGSQCEYIRLWCSYLKSPYVAVKMRPFYTWLQTDQRKLYCPRGFYMTSAQCIGAKCEHTTIGCKQVRILVANK